MTESDKLLLKTENPLVHKALEICKKYHGEQKDKNGRIYYEHPIRIASLVDSDEEKIVALLHDVIEDSDLTAFDLENMGIPKECIEAIVILTKPKDDAYGSYIKKIRDSENALAIRIKILDLKDNSNLTRIGELIEKDLNRTEKYLRALRILLDFEEIK